MKRVLLMIMFMCCVLGAGAQSSRHTQRTADPAEPNREEWRGDGHDHHDKPRNQQPMMVATPEQVKLMIEQLNKLSFSQDKIDFAYFCVKLLPVPAEGIMRLASTMSFDNDKLDFLKQAYRYCPDPYNYMVVEQAFSFKSNADELRKYIEAENNNIQPK